MNNLQKIIVTKGSKIKDEGCNLQFKKLNML